MLRHGAGVGNTVFGFATKPELAYKADMDVEKVRRLLAAECYTAGSQRAWAEKHGFSAGYVSGVLQRRKEPSAKMLAVLGLERVVRRTVTYRKAAKG
jgi:hypothetical protein